VECGGGEGTDERGEEYADDAGVDASQGGAKVGAGAEGVPEGKNGKHQKKARKEDAEEGGEAVERSVVGRYTDGGAEVSGEGEEWAGESLRCSVPSEEGWLGEPVWGDYRGFEQGENDVASTEDESSAAIERGGEGGQGCGVSAGGEFGDEEENKEEGSSDEAGGPGDRGGWGFDVLGERLSAFFAAE